MREFNDTIKPLLGLEPVQLSGEGLPVRGPVIDRRGYEAAVFPVMASTISGSPTRLGIAFKVQHCATATGTFADATNADAEVMGVTLSGTAAALEGAYSHIDVDLLNLERYIQLVVTPTFFEGSSPKVFVGAGCVLGEAKVVPAV